MDFQNAAATAVDIYIRNAQFEKAAAATPFRVGTQPVNNDPVLTQGRVMPIWVEGNAPTPADLYVRDGTNGWRKAWAAIKSRPQVGDRGLVEYVNAHHLSAEGGTMGTDTATDADGTTASGSGNNTAKVTWSSTSTVKRLTLTSSSTDLLAALRGGTWGLFLRSKFDAGTTVVPINAKWGYGDTTNVSTTNGTVTVSGMSSGVYGEFDLGYFVAPDVAAAGLIVEVWAGKTSGTGNLIMDSLVFAPADRLATITGPAADTTNWLHTSAEDLIVEEQNTSFQRVPTAWELSGQVPLLLAPGLNVLYVQTNQYQAAGTYQKSLLASAPTVKISYSPRHVS